MNYLKMDLPAISKNEKFARSLIAAFCIEASPNIEEINDIKTAISEAVTNIVVHAYDENHDNKVIHIEAFIDKCDFSITVTDYGKGIADLKQAMQPFYSSKSDDERSGMGFTVMQTFMDSVEVESTLNEGTKVKMTKKFLGGEC